MKKFVEINYYVVYRGGYHEEYTFQVPRDEALTVRLAMTMRGSYGIRDEREIEVDDSVVPSVLFGWQEGDEWHDELETCSHDVGHLVDIAMGIEGD